MKEIIVCEVCNAEFNTKTGETRVKMGTKGAVIKELKDEISKLRDGNGQPKDIADAAKEKRGSDGQEEFESHTII